jgi:CRP-like cAMP-binding protein
VQHTNTRGRSDAEANWLLRALPSAAYDAVLPHLEEVRLEQGQTLARPYEAMEYAYFPRGCVLSILVPMESRREARVIEAATVGWEGMIGVPLYLAHGIGPDEVVCQIGGQAARITCDDFGRVVAAAPDLRQALDGYALARMGQITRNAGCNRVHSAEKRCARWLLITQDRVGRDQFVLTQEFLARMVGVHRPRVSLIAATLQDAGLIRYHRGLMTIVDRQRLEQAACEDYLITSAMYDELYAAPEMQRRGRAPGRHYRNGAESEHNSVLPAVAGQVA